MQQHRVIGMFMCSIYYSVPVEFITLHHHLDRAGAAVASQHNYSGNIERVACLFAPRQIDHFYPYLLGE